MTQLATWESEMRQLSVKYFKIGTWVAAILNVAWVIGDYFTISKYWQDFFFWRVVVSVFLVVMFLIQRRSTKDPAVFIFSSYTALILQNGYFYSMIDDIEMFRQQTFTFLALFIDPLRYASYSAMPLHCPKWTHHSTSVVRHPLE